MNTRIILLACAGLVAGLVLAAALLLRDDTYRGAYSPPSMPSSDTLATVATARVFFGHQSVGMNILSGLEAIRPQTDATAWPIREISSADDISGPGLYHAKVGRNVDPLSKIAAWEEWLVARGAGARLDAAILKLCYVDLQKDTAVEPILEAYLAAVARIRQAHPHLVIVHASCPLTTHVRGFKSRLRNLLAGDGYNLARASYNRALAAHLPADATLFDIAAVESTAPDGTRVTHRFRGETFHSLYPPYTYDSGHLNDDGARRAAAAFLEAIATALHRRPATASLPGS